MSETDFGNFDELFNEMYGEAENFEHTVQKGTVLATSKDFITVDVGLKSEGVIPVREFGINNEAEELKVGDVIDVFVTRYEDKDGRIQLSRDKARREESWTALETSLEKAELVEGVINNRVKGGFTVDLNGAIAFLPGSQVDIHPVRDIATLIDHRFTFQILKMDRQRSNIVVSRRAVLEGERVEQRNELMSQLSEGQVLKGIVKNITDYGVFVDLGGIDGLLHITDISWTRINHPSEVLTIGQEVEVQVIRFNEQTHRISLGMKQLQDDPWKDIMARFTQGKELQGKITNITDYGAFVSLEQGVEGLVHVSEMSWTRKNIHPSKFVTADQDVSVKVMAVDEERRRISLSIKQCLPNPWEDFSAKHKVGDIIKGPIKTITEFGLFVGLNEDLDGMVHLSDLSWTEDGEKLIKTYKKGEEIEAKILTIDIEKERLSLGIKQLLSDPFADAGIAKGASVKGTITGVEDDALTVDLAEGIVGVIARNDVAKGKDLDSYKNGEEVEALVISIDSKHSRVTLSVKAQDRADEKEAMAKHNSDTSTQDSSTTLGDVFGKALNKK